MSRVRWLSLGVLVLLLALLPFVPHGGDDDGALTPTVRHSARHVGHLETGYGRVTPDFARKIDRVVVQGSESGRIAPDAPARTLVQHLVSCVSFERQRYCLGTGWTDRTQAQVRATMTATAAREVGRRTPVVSTGDLSLIDGLRQQARLSPSARAAQQRAELTQAARSVAKVWLIRHQIQGVPLPGNFFARHPEVTRPLTRDRGTAATIPRSARKPTPSSPTATATPTPSPTPTPTPTTAPTTAPTLPIPTPTATPTATSSPTALRIKHWRDYPTKATVLDPTQVAEQSRTYWCGPTSMQMITWGWKHKDLGQAYWAGKLGTTTSGTGIASMVHVVNADTGWDKKSYAGPYVVLDIRDWSFRQWMLLMMRHIVDYRAPVVLHPVLLTQFYPYLDHSGSGHFQVGRGYKKRAGKTPLLGYFEPWNQQLFHPDEPFIGRVQWRDAYKSYRANEAHFQHNLGV